MIDSQSVHATLGSDGWVRVLQECGVPANYLRNKHGPCPSCGGTDRFRFDNKGRGLHYCNGCGAGNGFVLVMKIFGCDFKTAFHRVLAAAGIESNQVRRERIAAAPAEIRPVEPPRRVCQILKETCAPEDCGPAIEYLASRNLWPLPPTHTLRAHPSVEYWDEGKSIGRFPALVVAVRNGDSELVTAHVTYLTQAGQKLAEYEPRKILSPLTGHVGCAAQLMPADGVLGIAEGIETALSATKLTGIPTWAALNSSLLAKFEVRESINRLVIFADRDIAGLESATKLMQKLQHKVAMDVRIPTSKDWNDALVEST